jgi:hypothetical protein
MIKLPPLRPPDTMGDRLFARHLMVRHLLRRCCSLPRLPLLALAAHQAHLPSIGGVFIHLHTEGGNDTPYFLTRMGIL